MVQCICKTGKRLHFEEETVSERQNVAVKMKRKFVIFDVDGTLVTKENRIPNGVREAIADLKRNGHRAIFFTGRPYSHVVSEVKKLGLDGCICTMGAYVRVGDQVIQNLLPDPKVTKKLVELIRACDLEAAFESEEGISFDETRPLSEFLSRLKSVFAARGFETDEGVDREAFAFSKLCVWSHEGSDMERFEREASRYLKVIGKKQNMMELVSKQASIEESVTGLMTRFGIEREDCYAVGDSVNDLPMLRCAAHTAAMGEAPDELKEQVEFVTSSIMDNGIIKFLQHYALI